jgi:hypothetical protein
VREALVDVLVDDVRLVQDQVALDEDRHLSVRVHHGDVFGLVVQVDVADFKVHALFEQHEAAAVRIGAGGARVQNHHGWRLLKQKTVAAIVPRRHRKPLWAKKGVDRTPRRGFT